MLNSRQQQEIRACCDAVSFDVSMAAYSTFKAGGQAAALAEVQNLDQLSALLEYCRREVIPWRVIGRGSNILVMDTGFNGVLFRLGGDFRTVQLEDESETTVISAGGGCLLADLLGWCRRHGLGGLEFLAGIPGGVGGTVRMNAGAFGHSIGEFLQVVSIIGADGVVRKKTATALSLDYRSCMVEGYGPSQAIILSVTLQLQEADGEQIAEIMRNYMLERKKNQPLSSPSAGSFFKNPEGDYAGRLIEAAGLKGARVGGAMVSPVHANFIVNDGGQGTAADILELMHKVQEKVRKQTGIFLEPEVHIF
ncbi:MAG: UDP-N-acetylmuramate dehydrogenase [Desulfobulbaceae bacterium]|nr:UDP-N-acetylmuramate dehydrogenase [Desulfobulbaceae bacterium]